MTDIAYCTRQQVQDALAQADTFRTNTRIDAAIRAAAHQVEAMTHRRFYPTTVTRYPEIRDVTGPVLWLDADYKEMISIVSFTVDGSALTEGTDFFLRPDGGPPFTSLKLMNSSAASFSSDDKGMILRGEQGASGTTRAAGVLAGALNDSQVVIDISDSSLVGVGDLLTVGTERMNVVGQADMDTTATLAGSLAANMGARAVTVNDGTLLHEGERITVGTERMFIESISGNTLTVRRAELGSILAAHSTSDPVDAPRVLRVVRGVTGTTTASHSNGATVLANDPPGLVKECSLAHALVNLTNSQAAYGRSGSGDSQVTMSGEQLKAIVDDLITAYGRHRSGAA